MAFIKVSECFTDPKQLTKLILLIVCICVTLYQLSECFNKLLNPSITSNYKLKANNTIKYPAVTVCRRTTYKKDLFPTYGLSATSSDLATMNAFRYFKFDEYTVSEFLSETTYDQSHVIPMWAFNGTAKQENVKFSTSYYPLKGACHTVIPQDWINRARVFSMTQGFWLYLEHNSKERKYETDGLSAYGFEIYIHDENDVVKSSRKNGQMDFLFVETSKDMRVVLNVMAVSKISTKEDPCSSDHSQSKTKCEERCVHNKIAETVGCTLPWLRYLDKEYKECSNFSTVRQIQTFFTENSQFWENFKNECDCLTPCQYRIYQYQIEDNAETDDIQAPSSTIRIYFATNIISEVVEVIGYDWNSFLSDVGGSLGFLLGLSVIGLVNIIEEVVKMIFERNKNDDVESKEKLPNSGAVSENDKESLKEVLDFMNKFDYQHQKPNEEENRY